MNERYAIVANPVVQSKSPKLRAGFARITGQDIHYEKLTAHYGEIFDRGTALVQMNFPPARIAKPLKCWAAEAGE